jgi:hypothetical protein
MRQVGARALAVVFALSWVILPGFGLIDLSVTWSSDWPQVLEAGWGLFFTVLVAAAFMLVAIQPPDSRAGVAQLSAATVCLAVSALASTEWRLFALALPLAVEAAVVGLLVRPAWLRPRRGRSVPLLVLAAAGIVPWIVYALHMWSLDRQGTAAGDDTVGIDHYSVQGALALGLAVLPAAAGLRRELRPFVTICAGLAAAYLGLVSLCHQGAAGGFARIWSALAIAWGTALVGAALSEIRRRARARPPVGRPGSPPPSPDAAG